MKIVVVGATGTAGVKTVESAKRAGHEVVALSRATGVDLHTGAGLLEGMAGGDVVIDTSNPFPTDPDMSLVEALPAATARLAAAAAQAGVGHVVFLSICNIDSPVFDHFDYYLAKRAQEQVVRQSDVSSSIVRSAQWMEFATNPAAVVFQDDRVVVQDWLIQPVAADSVADVLVQASVERPKQRQIAGPEPIHLPELTERLLRAEGDTRPVAATEPSLAELATGVLLAPAGAELIGPGPSEWLRSLNEADHA